MGIYNSLASPPTQKKTTKPKQINKQKRATEYNEKKRDKPSWIYSILKLEEVGEESYFFTWERGEGARLLERACPTGEGMGAPPGEGFCKQKCFNQTSY